MKTSNVSILVVDDDQLFGEKLKNFMHDYQVTLSHSAENGSHFVSLLKPELIFLDNKLPHLNGNDVISFYKELSPNSKIILMSAEFDINEIALAIQNKAEYVINKKGITTEQIQKIIEVFGQEKIKRESIWKLLGFSDPRISKEKIQVAVVEDDELFSFHLNWKLNMLLPQHSVNAFFNGESFFEYCATNSPSIILLDYHLPDYTGRQILEFIKENVPNAKVIILSSQNDPDVAIDFQHSGIAGYIIKNMTWATTLEQYIYELIP